MFLENCGLHNCIHVHVTCTHAIALMHAVKPATPFKWLPDNKQLMASNSVSGSLILHGVRPTGKQIGVGAYGRVFEVDYEGTLCAAKEVHALLLQYAEGDSLQKIKENFLSECQVWSILRHSCVVQFLGSVILVL